MTEIEYYPVSSLIEFLKHATGNHELLFLPGIVT